MRLSSEFCWDALENLSVGRQSGPTCLDFFEAVKERFSRRGFCVTFLHILRHGKSAVSEEAFSEVVPLWGFFVVKFCAGGGVVCCKIGAGLSDFAVYGQETETFETTLS